MVFYQGYLWKNFTWKHRCLKMRNRFVWLMKIKMRFHTVLPVTLAVSTLKSQCDASFLKKFSSQIYIPKKKRVALFHGTLHRWIQCMCCIMIFNLGLLSSCKNVSCGFLRKSRLKSGLTSRGRFFIWNHLSFPWSCNPNSCSFCQGY